MTSNDISENGYYWIMDKLHLLMETDMKARCKHQKPEIVDSCTFQETLQVRFQNQRKISEGANSKTHCLNGTWKCLEGFGA